MSARLVSARAASTLAAETFLTSPARRARATAASLGYHDATIDDALRDLDLGTWSGRRLVEIARDEPEAVATWLRDAAAAPHGGESIAALVTRAGAWLDGRTERGRLVCVTHPAFVRAAVLHVLDAPLASFTRIDVEPLRATDLSYDGRRWSLRATNLPL